jgi:GTP-binding protein EngB required for normal cell division
MSKEERAKLDALISWYIEEKKENIKKAILLIDSKI